MSSKKTIHDYDNKKKNGRLTTGCRSLSYLS